MGEYYGQQYIQYIYPPIINSTMQYFIIQSCLLDSKTDPGASKFISRTDKRLRFSIKAFQFITDPDAEVSVKYKYL